MTVQLPSLRKNIAAFIVGAALLAGCQESDVPKHLRPVPGVLSGTMAKLNMSETAPIYIRIFKESSELEIWKKQRDGKFGLLKEYHVCKWSGKLGPKLAEGDRQAPEGFYTVTPAQMNPKSQFYLSFNIGYPNRFDRAHKRTGTHLMVHGACSSAGCYSMTNEHAGELFALARDSFRGGQRAFQIHAFPFRMTPENMARHRDNENFEFWKMLKVGSDHFELTQKPPKVNVCDKRYVFDTDAGGRKYSPTGACPSYKVDEGLAVAVAAKQSTDDVKFTEAVANLAIAAESATEEERLAKELGLIAAANAAEKQASKAEKLEKASKGLGVFARLFGRDDKTATKDKAGVETAETSVEPVLPSGEETAEAPIIAFAPVATPIPQKKPIVSPEMAASVLSSPAAEVAPQPVTAAVTPQPSTAEVAPQPADAPVVDNASPSIITSEMTPEIPAVGSFVKKNFLWPEGLN